MTLLQKFEKFENWKEAEKISRREFEKLINNNNDLTDAYLYVYSEYSEYYKCKIIYEQWNYEQYIMCVEKKIILIFFRVSPPAGKVMQYIQQ